MCEQIYTVVINHRRVDNFGSLCIIFENYTLHIEKLIFYMYIYRKRRRRRRGRKAKEKQREAKKQDGYTNRVSAIYTHSCACNREAQRRLSTQTRRFIIKGCLFRFRYFRFFYLLIHTDAHNHTVFLFVSIRLCCFDYPAVLFVEIQCK